MAHDGVGEALSRRFRPYPAYKDSGVEWLGQIPAHWALCRLKFILQEPLHYGANEPAEQVDEDLPRYIRITDISDDGRLRGETFRSIPEAVAKPHLLQDGDILFARSGATVGKTFRYESRWGRAAHAGYLIRARLDRQACSSRFVQFFTTSQSYWNWMRSNFIQATIQNVSAERYGNLQIPIPKPREQQAIVNHLYQETAKIDRLVARKERLIELLQEKRNALIAQAVTRGLDPGVPMKESGVEWLGEIPSHWEVAPVYARYEVALGKMLDAKRVTGESLGKFLRNVDVQWDALNVDDLPEMDFSPSERNRYLLLKGDLLVCEGGEVGRTAIWNGELDECFYQKAIHRLRPRSVSEIPRFFFFLMYALARYGIFTAGGNPNTIDHLTAVQLRHYRMPFPNTTEQSAIAGFLDRETASIDNVIAKVRNAIDFLKEFRTALISATVTGKINVREARQARDEL